MPNESNQVGLILCECGRNISDGIDFDAIRAWAQKNPKIQFVITQELLCSPEGKVFLAQTLKQSRPGKVVVAACSPRMHENTFREILLACGRNLADLQMANLREHVAWVTRDKMAATEKAKALISAAVSRSLCQEKLEPKSMECITDVVVIGGGIAGMEAALLASQAGRKVTIIEKNISLGGRIIHNEEMAPNMECAPCLLSPRLFKIRDDANIRVVANAEILEILGFYGNFKLRVLQKARSVKDSCMACEACFEVCPVEVASDFHLGMGTRKAVHMLFSGAIPGSAAIDRSVCRHFLGGECNACVAACPFSAIDFTEQDQILEIPAGAIVIAIGGENYQGKGLAALGYPQLEQVYTLPEFERLVSSNGPTKARLLLKTGQPPTSIAVIHCAGSLSPDGVPYCSGICCMTALKVGAMARKQITPVAIHHVHNRLVFPRPEAEKFLQQQQAAGTQLHVTQRLSAVQVKARGTQLLVTAPDLPGLTVDMVVLATGIVSGKDTTVLAEQMNLEQTPEGFFKPDHYFLRSVGASSEGIYTVGACALPCDAQAAVLQAQAAMGDAISRLVPGRRIDLEFMTAEIVAAQCAGCKLCVAVCPYNAVAFEPEAGSCRVNEALCHGCGTCVATCPSNAAQAKHFTNQQIQTEIEELLHV